MLSSLSANLANVSGVKETFTKVEVEKRDNNYFLVFRGAKFITSFAVVVENNILRAKLNVSCSTTGDCANSPGCSPSQNVGECLCTRCPNDGTCIKTCTTVTLIDVENL